MKIKKVVLSIIVATLIYSVVVLMISPFAIAFQGRTFFNTIMNFLLSFPINWKDLIVNKSILFLVLNGFFWSIIGHIIFYTLVIFFKQKNN